MLYDVFYVSTSTISDDAWKEFRERVPLAHKVENVTSFADIKKKAFTKLFWVVWDDLDIAADFNFDYEVPDWDQQYIHVFKNGKYFDGVAIFPKSAVVSSKEFKHRFYTGTKEINILASTPKQYDKFVIDTYADYEKAVATSTTEMFWCIWSDVTITDEAVFDLYYSHHEVYDRSEHHIFKNLRNNEETYLSGIVLCSKDKQISNREISRRYVIDKKEHDEVVSKNVYRQFIIDTYADYEKALTETTTEMFWCIWPEVTIIDESVFDLFYDPNNGIYDHDRSTHHIFKNLRNNEETYLSGIVLCSKDKQISNKEISRRYVIDKKEHDEVVSKNVYNKFVIDTYADYEKAVATSTTEMFWIVWPEVTIIDESVFDLFYDPNNGIYDHDRSEHHVFAHIFKGEETYAGGVVLCSKDKLINQREFTHRFIINRKEHPEVVSKLTPYDIVFISYYEKNADINYANLLKRFPRAKRVDKVDGIHQAHIEAAKKCTSDMIWIVDGDAEIVDDFNFDHEVSTYERDIVHVWRSQNPINGLVYGYGGVKLLPRTLTLNMDVSTPDMTTAISDQFRAVPVVSNITAFNTDEFSAWRSAFRECVKLSSKVISRQKAKETAERLEIWCTKGKDKQFGEYAINGAKAGKDYGSKYKDNPDKLKKINDFSWLNQHFKESHEQK